MNNNTTKYALITGASGGIGRATAEVFAEHGYHLYLVCHTQDKVLTELANDLVTKYQITCRCFSGDLSDSSFCKTLVSQIKKIDIVVNNAGIAHFALLQDMSDADWNRILSTNLTSVFYICREVIPLMLQQHSGHIINISSVWGNSGASMEVAYSASKGGINAMTKALAKELAPSQITVNAVAFGMIDTPMNQHLQPEDLAALCDEIPAGRIASPMEAAQMIYMVSTAPDYLTGQIITMDGGWNS